MPRQRKNNELRKVEIHRGFTKHAEGSVLICMGETRVLCTASVVDGVPKFLKDKKQGWVTAEYGMLPRSTHQRMDREAARGKQSGRTQEIQRLIGRSLRSVIDLSLLGEYTIMIDCDVIQADGGTRTASITGACIALYDAVRFLQQHKGLQTNPFRHFVAAISVGVVEGEARLDLDYLEDSSAETDMNIIMNEKGQFIELQGTAEQDAFTADQLEQMLGLGREGITQLIELQKKAIA